jgi:hypothetical protein
MPVLTLRFSALRTRDGDGAVHDSSCFSSFVAQGHAVYAGTCGFVMRLG